MSADETAQFREEIRNQLNEVVALINEALRGKDLEKMELVLARIGRGNVLPHWYAELRNNGALPNLDGKTIGSVVEMLFVAVLETQIFTGRPLSKLRINPARGVDLPDLDLGVKSPSENFCTSEPFYSAYERLLGSEYDVVVLLTDYQTAKSNPPLRLQIKDARYLRKTQIADANLCSIARKHRDWLVSENEARAQKFFRFLAFVNQSDWRARQLLRLLTEMDKPRRIEALLIRARMSFQRRNEQAVKQNKVQIPDVDWQALHDIRKITPLSVGVIDAADDWVIENCKEAGRAPNENEWRSLKGGPLDGAIGMSFALQWRYNFGRLFGREEEELESEMLGLE